MFNRAGNTYAATASASHEYEEWTEHYDQTGRKYYANVKTGESRWEKPRGQRDLIDPNLATLQLTQHRRLEGQGIAPDLPSQWTKKFDYHNRPYYANSPTGKVKWDHPMFKSGAVGDSRETDIRSHQNLWLSPRIPSIGAMLYGSPSPVTNASPNLLFDSSVKATLRPYFSELAQGIPWFPSDMRDIRIATVEYIAGPGLAFTHWKIHENGSRTISVTLECDPHQTLTDSDLVKILYVFAHELGGHALQIASRFSERKAPLPEVVQHKKFFFPSDESNPWHIVFKEILRYVKPAWKVEFLKHYVADLTKICEADYEGIGAMPEECQYARYDEEILKRGMMWIARLEEHAKFPDSAFWSPRWPGDRRNPLAATADDEQEAEDYNQLVTQRRRS